MNSRIVPLAVVAGMFMLAIEAANAMPNFARKHNAACALCHTTIPRLNAVGFDFRAAGFRMPEDIGKPEPHKFDLGDFVSGRLQARYDVKRSETGAVSTLQNQLAFHEVTIYPTSGSWAKYFSSLFELSIAPEEPVEIENAYLRVNKGGENRFLTARVGIFHPFEGFGASDRPIALSRPFFQTSPANHEQTTYFTPWGFDEAGGEVGLNHGPNSIRLTLFNGLVLGEEEGAIKAFPAQGGALSKGTALPGHNRPDFQVFANRILHPNGGNVSIYYYRGGLALPVGGDIAERFDNTFQRVALYGGYPVLPKLLLLSAFQYGHDHLVSGGTFNSRGVFFEGDVPINDYLTAGVRYDHFDPSIAKSSNEISGVTTFVNIPLQNGFQLIGEYQHKKTLRGAQPTRRDDAFQVRIIFIL